MEISNLALVVTDACNYKCSYCFQQKEKNYMNPSTIEKTISIFYPWLKEDSAIVFWGGEPLLAFDRIKQAVFLLLEKDETGKKKLNFYLTTNGSLINEEILDFFNRYRFDLMLSFDGLTQDTARKSGSLKLMQKRIKQIRQYPNIVFSVNSVFTPETVGYFSASLRFIIQAGVPEILVSLSSIHPWHQKELDMLAEEYDRLVEFLVSYYKDTGEIPLKDFKVPQEPPKKGFVCLAGRNRIAVSPQEDVWGCYLFYDYLKQNQDHDDYQRYHLGKLADFIGTDESLYAGIIANYCALSQSMFFTEKEHCFLCPEVEHCITCPVNAAFSTSFIGKIPSWLCNLNRIQKNAQEKFLKKIKVADS